MKKAILGLLLSSTFVAASLHAQRSGNPPSAADMAQRKVSMLTRQLTLTEAQQQQAATIFNSAVQAQSAAREGLRTARQTISDAVKTNNIAAIDQASATIGNLTAQITSSEAKADAAFYQLLTPDQQSRFRQFPGAGPGGFGGFSRGQGRGPRGN
ncbi:MAG TPA: Spy/CpxP family protein refolding chaperone [Bryobacteraceae bacterium]|nr:Spy/CpxP family protein refolding chaperone [Bryobacteraceae bacterium]